MRSSLLAIALFVAPAAWPQPVVNAVVNTYSYTLPGLPSYGIAQGSIFAIFGANLAATPSNLQALPLRTVVNGVSVQISVGGVTTQAPLYYVLPNQIAGVLPSATPVGTGQITVTLNGQTSAPAPITVVQSAFGIDASPGSYPVNAAVLEPDVGYWRPLTATNAANPGEAIEIYGTGAGPASGTESAFQPPENLINIPMEVDIGGIPATVTYHGRPGGYPGLDQINVVIPPGPVGCNVSVVVVTSGFVSNVAFLPVAAQGRTCTDQVPGVTLPVPVTVGAKSTDNVGIVFLNRTLELVPPLIGSGGTQPAQNNTVDFASAMFQRFTSPNPAPFSLGGKGVFPSLGSCTTISGQIPPPPTTPTAGSSPPFANLNAGPSINFSSPSEVRAAPLAGIGYNAILSGNGTSLPPFFPAAGGIISIDNGAGGPDVGAFSTQVNAAPPLVWTNMAAIPASIDRSKGVTLTWAGGNPAGIVSITAVSSEVNAAGTLVAQVNCAAPVAAGQFTIPPSALLTLPPSLLTPAGPNATLQLQTQDQFPFTAPGLDAGIIYVEFQNRLTVPYQ